MFFQRFGESVQDTYIQTMKDLFGSGAGRFPKLLGVTLASDRGYWEKGLLFDQMMEGGADIIGTVKRVRMVGCCVICRHRNFFLVSHDYPLRTVPPVLPRVLGPGGRWRR